MKLVKENPYHIYSLLLNSLCLGYLFLTFPLQINSWFIPKMCTFTSIHLYVSFMLMTQLCGLCRMIMVILYHPCAALNTAAPMNPCQLSTHTKHGKRHTTTPKMYGFLKRHNLPCCECSV